MPKCWNLFWYMLQVCSLGCRLKWSLLLECLSGVPFEPTLVESRGKKQDRAEGRINWNNGFSISKGSLEWPWPFRFVLTYPLARPLWFPLDGSVHTDCPQRGWWFKFAHWQHFHQWDNGSLKEGLDSRFPCPSQHVSQLQR